jgi:hypothetical protein
MIRRVLRQHIFLGSTTEEINAKVDEFLLQKQICVGNYVDFKLEKLGNVYQYIFVYAELIGLDPAPATTETPF